MLLEALYESHKDEITGALTRYSRDREAAADAVQEAFLKALKNRDVLSAFEDKAALSWLYTTARNALTDEKRRTSRWDAVESFDERSADEPSANPVDAIMVRELLHKLPPHLIHVVSLKYFGNLNSVEIGRIIGIPPATVRSRLRAALSILRGMMERED